MRRALSLSLCVDVKAKRTAVGVYPEGLTNEVTLRRSFQVTLDRAATSKLADMLEKAELSKQKVRS